MADADDDPSLDYTDKYNTPLTPQEESDFQSWVATQSVQQGRDVSNDLYDYDLRGDWQQGAQRDPDTGHGSDYFKKPNHITFSTGSKYNDVDGEQGGTWVKKSDNTWSFAPGASNLKNYSPDQMRDYFKRVEPGNELLLPDDLPRMRGGS